MAHGDTSIVSVLCYNNFFIVRNTDHRPWTKNALLE